MWAEHSPHFRGNTIQPRVNTSSELQRIKRRKHGVKLLPDFTMRHSRRQSQAPCPVRGQKERLVLLLLMGNHQCPGDAQSVAPQPCQLASSRPAQEVGRHSQACFPDGSPQHRGADTGSGASHTALCAPMSGQQLKKHTASDRSPPHRERQCSLPASTGRALPRPLSQDHLQEKSTICTLTPALTGNKNHLHFRVFKC